MKYLWNILIHIICIGSIYCHQSPPHIIFCMADDLGWNDVSFHGSKEIPTPNIDTLAMNGIVLNKYYGYWLCSPNRGALLSGISPTKLGLQHFVLLPGERTGLPLNVKTIANHMKDLGYATHMIGKWHLGYMTKAYTPTYRGFDSHYGFWNGGVDYFDYNFYDYTHLPDPPTYNGIDMYNNTDLVRTRGKFTTDLFTEVAEEKIRSHDINKPMFLYFSYQVPHIGNWYDPLQAPPYYVERVKHIKDPKRRIYAAMVLSLDDSIGKVYRALHEKGMLENSIFVFTSDNGGFVQRSYGGVASNYPLRGSKGTLWEGGNRLPALIWSPRLHLQEPRISGTLFQVMDWLPTLYEAAGGNPRNLGIIDGMSQWKALTKNAPSPRNELLYNIDPIDGSSAIRIGDMKVINGSQMTNEWYNPPTYGYLNSTSYDYYGEHGHIIKNILLKTGRWINKNPDEWKQILTLQCSQPPPENDGGCFPSKKPCLFNLAEDPCEYHNLADAYPDKVIELMSRIKEHEKTAVPPQFKPSDPAANPACHNFTYVAWLEPEEYTPCTEYFMINFSI